MFISDFRVVDYHFWYQRTSWFPDSNFQTKIYKRSQCVVPRTLVKDQNWLNLSLKGILFFRHLANWKLLLTLGRQHQKRIASFNEKTSRFDGKTWKQSQIICRIWNFLRIFLFIRSEIPVSLALAYKKRHYEKKFSKNIRPTDI